MPALMLVVIAGLATGCANGDGTTQDEKQGTGPPRAGDVVRGDHRDSIATNRELLARVSAAIRIRLRDLPSVDVLAYADLAAARRQLSLADDAGVPGHGKRRLLSSFAARPLFHFEPAFWWYGERRHPELRATGPRSLGPLGDVLDTGAIEVAIGSSFAFSGPLANGVGPEDTLVLRTRQAFGEIADRLREDGYVERSGGLLVDSSTDSSRIATDHGQFPFRALGSSGGVVVLAGSPRAARAALGGRNSDLTPAAKLLVELPGVARVARGAFGRCGVAFGLGEDAVPREGQLRVVIEGQAKATRMVLSGVTAVGIANETRVEFADATADGKRAGLRFTSTDHLNATRVAIENAELPYSCRESVR